MSLHFTSWQREKNVICIFTGLVAEESDFMTHAFQVASLRQRLVNAQLWSDIHRNVKLAVDVRDVRKDISMQNMLSSLDRFILAFNWLKQ